MIGHLLTGDACTVGALYAHPMVEAVLGGSLHPGGTTLTLEMARVAGIGADDHVLDVGCGKGASARALSAATGCRVTGVDVSAEAIEAARSAGGDRLRFEALDGPLAGIDGTFDAVLSECALCLQDADSLLDFHALLAPGGHLLLSDVVVEAPAASFRSAAGFVACLGGARPYDTLVHDVQAAGFDIALAQNRPELVRAVRDRIHARIDVAAVLAALGDDVPGLARLVAEAEVALEAGHLGYAVIVASRRQ